jgi:hypothetical protein
MKRLSLLFVLASLVGCGTVTSGGPDDGGTPPPPMIDASEPVEMPPDAGVPDARPDATPGTALAEGVEQRRTVLCPRHRRRHPRRCPHRSLKGFFMRAALLAVTGLLAAASSAHADPAVPLQLPVTVRIARDGVPVDETVALKFSIFTEPTAGTSLWNGVAHNVVVNDGIASDTLGLEASNPLNPDHFNGRVLYLQVVVAGYEMPDRIPLRSVPYALRASTADTARLAATATLADKATLADRATRADGAALAESLGLPTTPAAQRMTIDQRGFVGLATAPTERLHVNGNVRVDGAVRVDGPVIANPTYAVATLNQSFETTSQNLVPVTNAVVTVTTHGKPVLITATATFQALGEVTNYLPWGQIGLYRDGAALGPAGGVMAGASEAQSMWGQDPISFTFVDVPGAGQHTYQLMFKSGTGTRMRLTDGVTTQIAAIELN